MFKTGGHLFFYGGKKTTRIQDLYCEFYHHTAENHFSPFLTYDKTNEINRLLSTLESEIDKVMPSPKSPNYKKYLAMKTCTYFFRTSLGLSNHKLDSLEPALKLIEPLKHEKEGICLYIRISQRIAAHYIENAEHSTALKYLLPAEKAYKFFIGKFPNIDDVALTEFDLFDVNKNSPLIYPSDICSNIHSVTMVQLFECYNATKDVAMQLKYVVPSLKNKTHDPEDFQRTNFARDVQKIRGEIVCLIKSHYFGQVNHVLAGIMLKLVKERRTFPEEDQLDIKKAQALMSSFYALWAVEILEYSLELCKDKKYTEKHPINNEVEKFPELNHEGIEIYENQFPCEPISDRENFRKSLKKGKSWCKRANDLVKNWLDVETKVIMEAFESLETALEKMPNFK